MSFPKDFPPPDGPPPLPPTDESKSKPPKAEPKQKLQPQATSKSHTHLARKTPPPRPPRTDLGEKVRQEAEKTADTAEQIQKEPKPSIKPPGELKKREITAPKLPTSIPAFIIPNKAPPKPLAKQTNQPKGTPVLGKEKAADSHSSSGPHSSKRSSEKDDSLRPPSKKEESRIPSHADDDDWENLLNQRLEPVTQEQFSGTTLEELQSEEITSLARIEEKGQISNILKEILATESTFFESIKDLPGFFSKLKIIFEKEHSKFINEDLLKTKPDYFDEMALAWEKMSNSSLTFSIYLDQILNSTASQKNKLEAVLLLFSKNEIQGHLENLKALALGFSHLRNLIEEIKSEPRKSAKLIVTMEHRSLSQVITIPQLLIMGVQRPPRYMLLMKELVKRISRIPEYENLLPQAVARLKYIEGFVNSINEAV